jgi:LysM repeat protein
MGTWRRILLLAIGLLILAAPVLAQEQIHTVQPGENLYRISLAYGVDMKIIAQANNIANTALVYVGQKLIIPDMSQAADGELFAAEPTYYTVQPGDSLLRIANLYGLTVQQLAQINNLADINHIVPGQQLTVFTQPLTETAPSTTEEPTPMPEATTLAAEPLEVTPAVTLDPLLLPQPTAITTEEPIVDGTPYTIQAGETLASIAMSHGVTWPAIVQANNITDPNQIMPGETIIIPNAGSITNLGIISPSSMPMAAPAPTVLVGKQIIVDLSDQRTYAYENGVLVRNTLVSTGLPATPTVLGSFTVQRKYESQLMSGPGYYLPNVQWISYFYAGYAIHGTYWHNNFGQPMSHGCVNMPNEEALWYYNFAPVGTPVLVQV